MEADEKKIKVATWLKWVGGLAGMAIISPIVFFALKGLLGLMAIGVAATAGLVMLRLSPILSMKVSNLLLRGIANEAAANPIETMQNLLIEKSQELADADKAIVEFETAVSDYNDKTAEFSRQYPEEAPRYKQIGETMEEGLAQQKQKQEDAREKLVELGQKIEKAKAIYAMSKSAEAVTSASKSAEKEIWQNIRETVALDSVRTALNRSFASLNMSIAQGRTSTSPKAIAGNSTPVLNSVPRRVSISEEEPVAAEISNRKGKRP